MTASSALRPDSFFIAESLYGALIIQDIHDF